jgi:hypothetical protein
MNLRFVEAQAKACKIAAIAQSETVWTSFVRSGEAANTNEVTLRHAMERLERALVLGKGGRGSREHRRKAIERLRCYLDEKWGSF